MWKRHGPERLVNQLRVAHAHRDVYQECHHTSTEMKDSAPCETLPQPSQLLSGCLEPNRGVCAVCNDIWKTSSNTRSIQATETDVCIAAERGCPTCSLISDAATIFCSHVNSDESESADLVKVDGFTIFPDKGRLLFRLSFQNLDGVHDDVLLHLFSPRESSEFPVFKTPNCISSKLCLSDLKAKVAAWIQNCDSKHIHCRVPECPVLPSRVIDVGSMESFDDIKLVLSHGKSARYLALSYCWGTGAAMIQTTSSSLATWTEGIPWHQLPKTFQDAIAITRKLEIQYVWIDALCIVQDDTQDWEFESANMANVYSNSYITIAATSAPDSHHGLLTDRWTQPCIVNGLKTPVDAHHLATSAKDPNDSIFMRPRLHLAHDRFCNMENAMYHVLDAPLLTRAWAFQERLLPSRTLHFHAEELVWECKSSVQCECQSLDRTYSFEEMGMEGWLKNFVTGSLHANNSVDELGHVWLDLVSEFGALRLTNESDRLPALSGLASKFSGKCLGKYVAGIWEHDVARGLLFVSSPHDDHQSAQQNEISSPSWSWASAYLRGSRISYGLILNRGLIRDSSFRILGIDFKPSSSNPFSWVEQGDLHVQGRCSFARIATASNPQYQRQKTFVIKVDGVQKSIPLEHFASDGDMESLNDTPLYCLLVGKQDESWPVDNDLGCTSWEYALVLSKVSKELNTYKRVGLLSIMDVTCSLHKEPVLTVILV